MNTKTEKETVSHTPGPWKYHLGRGANPRFHIQMTSGYQIASTTEVSRHREEAESQEANARLIAAAPELLEACKRLSEKVARANAIQHSGGKIEPEDWSELYQINNEARAAIAKAKKEAA